MCTTMSYYVYIIASRKDGATYIGVTNDIIRRIYEHRTKAVPSFTSKYNITRLVWFEIYEDPISAISREKELKKWKRAWKIELIEAPIASATAPPTPVSISSNTRVGAEPRSDSTTLSASRKRDSSPPEATFISGPGLVPGLVCTQNSTRSKPCGPGDFGSESICVMNSARSSFSGASSALTALLSFCADLVRATESLPAPVP